MDTTSNSDHDLWMTKILNAVRSIRQETQREGLNFRLHSHDADGTAAVLGGTVLAPRAGAR